MRQPIDLENSFVDFVRIMAEENAEAARLIEKIIVKFRGNAVNILLLLADMNIRGQQICYLINSICKGDLDIFFNKLRTDPSIAVEINNISKISFFPEKARSVENVYLVKEKA